MSFRWFALCAAAFGTAALALAQAGVAGKWSANLQTPQGALALSFDLAVAGKVLTGSMSNDFMGTTPITNGTVDGDNVAFKLSFAGPDGASMVISYTGVVKGDSLTLTSKFDGAAPGGGPAEQTFVATRVQ